MSGTVLLVGALDTKGVEYAFVKDLIEAAGLQTLVVDFGVMGHPAFEPDVSRAEVAAAAGGDLAYLASGTHKDEAMRTMAQGLASVVERLYREGRFDGVLGMGGSGGTSLATAAMRTLPVGVPKLMVSTVGGGDVSPYAGSKDITFMPSVVDVAGINRLSRAIYANAAGAIAGMVRTEAEATSQERPLIAASMFGNTTAAVDHARGLLEAEGYEVLVFHATGSGGRTMEDLISDGYIAGCLDMTTTELADEICDGVFNAGPDRAQAAPRQGIPTVIVPGCVDMANFGGIETVPDHYRQRNLYQWNPEVTLLRTNEEENRQMGAMLATAANAGQAGKVSVLIPLGGVSMLDSEGDRFWDPGADSACFDALKNDLRADIPLVESDANINDPEFAEKAVALLLEMLRAQP